MRVFDLNHANITRAMAYLGVTTRPTFVVSYSMAPHHRAEVNHEIDFREHRVTGERRILNVKATIRLNGCLSVEDASLAIWHELTHMSQYERGGYLDVDARYSRELGNHGYESCPMEVEARHVADVMHPLLPLTTPRKEEG